MPSPLYYLATFGVPASQTLINLPMPINWNPATNTIDFSGVNVLGLNTGSLPITLVSGAGGFDYLTVIAALTAGKTRIVVVGNTTETGQFTLPSGANSILITILPGVTVSLQGTSANSYWIGSNNSGSTGNIYFIGGGTIAVPAQATPILGQLYSNLGSVYWAFDNIIFSNAATDHNYVFQLGAPNGFTRITDCSISVTGAQIMNLTNAYVNGFYCRLSAVIQPEAIQGTNVSFSNMRFEDIATSGSSTNNFIFLISSTMTSCISNLARSYMLVMGGKSIVSDFVDVGTAGVDIVGEASTISNHILGFVSPNGSIGIGVGGDDFRAENCSVGLLSTSTSNAPNVPEVISNCLFSSVSASTLNCSYVRIQSCQFIGILLINGTNSVAGTQVTNCDFGVPGAGTVASPLLQITSGASGTILSENRLNAATSYPTGIKDLGTGTQLSINSTW